MHQTSPQTGRLWCYWRLLGLFTVLALSAVVHAAGRECYCLPLVSTPPTLDGKVGKWRATGDGILIDAQHLNGGSADHFRDAQDCSGRFWLAYDAKYLYVALSVIDDNVRPLIAKSEQPGKFWQQDGMGLYLDVPGTNVATGRYNTLPTRPWSQEPILQLTPSTNNYGADTLPIGSKYACNIEKKGYSVEIAVPWAALGWQPIAGDRLRFSAILADVDPTPDGKSTVLKQYLWHMPGDNARPANRGWAEARLMGAGGYAGEILTAIPAVIQGSPVAWKLQADAVKPGWQITRLALVGAGGEEQSLAKMPVMVGTEQRVQLAGEIDTGRLKPGVYALESTATQGKQVEKTQQPLTVIDEQAVLAQHKAPVMPGSYYTPDPLRSGVNIAVPHRAITHADYLAFVRGEMESGWGSYEYHVKLKTLSLGGAWYQAYGLRAAAYAKITKEPVWLQRAQAMFEMADASYKANNYAGLGWIDFPQVYYYKQYLTALNGWKPEYDAMAKDWFLHVYPRFPQQTFFGMNNWGLSFGMMGVVGKYWLGDALPDKAQWDKQIDGTWGEFISKVKDIDENTTNYAPWDLWLIFLYLDINHQTDLLKTDARLRGMFERYLLEITPSGGRPQYGSTNGWHDHPAIWMYLFERVGQITGDGRYKAQARLLWDYSLRHVEDWHEYHLVYDTQLTWLTRLLADVPDDNLPATPVADQSVLTWRGAMRMLSPEERAQRNMWCETTAVQVPNKLILRGTNTPDNPADKNNVNSMWAMIELNNDAGHCSARPTSVNCLMSNDAVLLSSQGYYEQDPQFHNMVFIEDLEGTQGIQPEMNISVPVLVDGPQMTYAVAEVERYMRWPVTLRRHFLFAKDRFLWVRDELTFNSTFFARIGPCWLSRQMGPTGGKDWTNTYFDAMPYTGLGQGNGMFRWRNSIYDLLTYYVPRPGMELAMSDLTVHNPYMNAPLRTRQTWRGLAREGRQLVFDTLLIPHAVKYQKADASWLANTIHPLTVGEQQAAIQFELPWRNEKVLVICTDKPYAGNGVSTDAQFAMIVWRNGKVANWFVRQATRLTVDDVNLLTTAQPTDQQK